MIRQVFVKFPVSDEGIALILETTSDTLTISWYTVDMDFSLAFIVRRFLSRIYDFFHHWYTHGSRRIGHSYVNYLSQLDEVFALKVTIRYFTQPLYKDYTIVGRILGIVFRTGRIIIGGLFYLCASFVFLVAYILWLATPIVLLLYAAKDLLHL